MVRPSTRSQDGGAPPLTIDNQAAEDQSTIVDDNTTQALNSRSVVDDHSSPFFLSTGDHPGLVLVSIVLNDTNYQPWKRGITMALTGTRLHLSIDLFLVPNLVVPISTLG
uniref:Retrotransposon Copia-like N-terminal domain-containing protein n=1 Tax=Cannabis sativa TaxID=3483 RepID=A0A803QE25_CANSA